MKRLKSPLPLGIFALSLPLLLPAGAFASGSVCVQKYGSRLCVTQGETIILKRGPESFNDCYVQSLADDGSMSCYSQDTHSTEAMNLNSVDVVSRLSSLDDIRQGSDILVRESAENYVSYYVSTIYNDGTFALYNRSTYKTTYITRDALLKKHVTTASQIDLTIPTYNGSKAVAVRQGSDVILRLAAGNYVSYYVSTIYSDNTVAFYNRSTYRTSYYNKDTLAQMLVENLSSTESFQVGKDITVRESNKVYKSYYLSNIYSDGIVALYDRGKYTTTYRPLAELDQQDVTNLSQLNVTIQTIQGSRASTLKQGSDIVLKLDAGHYASFYVATIYSDEEVALYDRATYVTTYYSKAELSSLLVEKLSSLQNVSQGSWIALPKAESSSVERSDYYISAIYTDGVVALYDDSNYQTTYQPMGEVSSKLIRVLDSIDPYHAQSIYLVNDLSGQQLHIQPVRFYEDGVIRYSVLKKPMNSSAPTQLASVKDLALVQVECDSSSTQESCLSWWNKKSTETSPAQPTDPSAPVNPSTPTEAPSKPLQALPESTPLMSLSSLGPELQMNQGWAAPVVLQNGAVVSESGIDEEQSRCSVSWSPKNLSVKAGDRFRIMGTQYSVQQSGLFFWASTEVGYKYILSNGQLQLELDCQHLAEKPTLGELGKILGGSISIGSSR